MEGLIATFGYGGVALGVAIEGEAVVLVASYLAQEGLLSPAGVALSAFAGSVGVYNLCFWLGRRHGRAILALRPAWQARVDHVRRRVRAHEVALILGYRLLFGLRAATPFALGLSGVSHRRFLVLDTPVAALWAGGLVAAGYALGRGAAALPGRLADAVGWLVLAAAALCLLWLTLRGWRAYRRRPRADEGPPPARPTRRHP